MCFPVFPEESVQPVELTLLQFPRHIRIDVHRRLNRGTEWWQKIRHWTQFAASNAFAFCLEMKRAAWHNALPLFAIPSLIQHQAHTLLRGMVQNENQDIS